MPLEDAVVSEYGPPPDFHLEVKVSFESEPERWLVARLYGFNSEEAYLTTPISPGVGERMCLGEGLSCQTFGCARWVKRISDSEWNVRMEFKEGDNLPDEWSPSLVVEPDGLKRDAFSYYTRLRRVREYVQKNYSEDVSLDKAARVAALEKTYFSAFFHSKVGVRYHEWVQNVRIRKAVSLLEKRDFSVTEVANAVGFNDLRTFQRVFRKWMNMTPRDFKRLARQ